MGGYSSVTRFIYSTSLSETEEQQQNVLLMTPVSAKSSSAAANFMTSQSDYTLLELDAPLHSLFLPDEEEEEERSKMEVDDDDDDGDGFDAPSPLPSPMPMPLPPAPPMSPQPAPWSAQPKKRTADELWDHVMHNGKDDDETREYKSMLLCVLCHM
jgi:hypothetical protein